MRSTRIFTAQPLYSNTILELEAEPSRHIARALRLRVGDSLTLFNGQGGEYPAELVALDKKSVTVTTGEHVERECESDLGIHLGIGVSRGERMDWIVQKSTELGICALTPLVTAHSGVKLNDERAEKKRRHWQQIAISACEQSGRNRVPVIHPAQALDAWVETTPEEYKLVLDPQAFDSAVGGPAPATLALLVGPEGGLSEAEVLLAGRAGFQALRLGPRILRTETAPLAAIAVLQSYWGDMRPA